MSVLQKEKSLPVPQPVTQAGMGSTESIPRLRETASAALSQVLRVDLVRRSGALLTFALAILIVLFASSGALAQSDSDNDGLSDSAEVSVHGTDPGNGDTDLDGLPDGVEVDLGTSPLEADSDGDGISDAEEYLAGNNPLVADAAAESVAVTAVPTTVVSGSNQVVTVAPVTVAQAPVTVSPEAVDGSDGVGLDSAPESLAFNDSDPSDRSPLFPVYVGLALAVSFGLFVLMKRIPEVS